MHVSALWKQGLQGSARPALLEIVRTSTFSKLFFVDAAIMLHMPLASLAHALAIVH